MTQQEILAIKDLLARTTPGEWKVNSISVKNGILTSHGDWPEADDLNNHEFLAKSKDIIVRLLCEYEHLQNFNKQLQEMVGLGQAQPCRSYT
jgi:hypothetical protein